MAADDGGVIKAVGVIHTRYAGLLHRTTLNQGRALIYLSKVMQNEQQDAKKHPLFPIVEKAANGQ